MKAKSEIDSVACGSAEISEDELDVTKCLLRDDSEYEEEKPSKPSKTKVAKKKSTSKQVKKVAATAKKRKSTESNDESPHRISTRSNKRSNNEASKSTQSHQQLDTVSTQEVPDKNPWLVINRTLRSGSIFVSITC